MSIFASTSITIFRITRHYNELHDYFPRWSGGKEDKYFARLGKNIISVYETETFSLVDKKSLKVENVMDFSWSPTDPILALFVPELGGGNQPARVSADVSFISGYFICWRVFIFC